MLLLTSITNAPNQQFTVVLPDNTIFTLYLEYLVQFSAWFYGVSYVPASLNYLGQQLTNNLNLLSPFVNILDFGILCEVIDGGNPWDINDFINQRVNLYLLNQDDINTVQVIYNTNPNNQ